MKVSILVIALASTALMSACVTTGGTRPVSDAEAALANLNLGIGYLTQGRPDAAVNSLERAISLNPRLSDAHSALALAYDQLDEPELAEEHHMRATQLDPGNSEAQNSYAVFLCRRDPVRWDDARRYFDRAVANPRYENRDTALANAGICARRADDPVSAESYLRQALAANPVNVIALNGMLELSVQTQNFLQARAFSQRLASVGTLNSRQLLLCYLVEQELGDARAAENCADELGRQFPGSAELRQLRELVGDAGQ